MSSPVSPELSPGGGQGTKAPKNLRVFCLEKISISEISLRKLSILGPFPRAKTFFEIVKMLQIS